MSTQNKHQDEATRIVAAESQRIVDSAFNEARRIGMEPSPYLRTRILAELRERNSRKSTINLWRWVASGCFTMAMGLLIWTSVMKHPAFEAAVHQPYVVRVEMAELQTELIAGAEISLPDGVYFYSEAIPDLKEKRVLDLAWNARLNKPVLPFVIKGEGKGFRQVKVKFFNSAREVVAERTLTIEFKDKTS
jgi:hypothetical protein